jgi:hypothetical protein
VSDTWDDEDRAIARALDAAPDAQPRDAEPGLVDQYLEVLADLSVAEIAPPADLEERVLEAALARRRASIPTLDRARTRRHNRVRLAALCAATVAAALVIGLIVRGGSTESSTPGGRVSLATQKHADVDALVRSAGARSRAFGNGVGRVVVAANGRSAVYDLRNDEPIAISLVSAGGTTMLGPARPVGGIVAFTVDHPERVTAVALLRNGAEVARVTLTPN